MYRYPTLPCLCLVVGSGYCFSSTRRGQTGKQNRRKTSRTWNRLPHLVPGGSYIPWLVFGLNLEPRQLPQNPCVILHVKPPGRQCKNNNPKASTAVLQAFFWDGHQAGLCHGMQACQAWAGRSFCSLAGELGLRNGLKCIWMHTSITTCNLHRRAD